MAEKQVLDVSQLITDVDSEFENKEEQSKSTEEAVSDEQDATNKDQKSLEDDKNLEDDVEFEEEEDEEVTEEEEDVNEEEEEDEGESQDEESVADINDPDIHKRNDAFKKLREERDSLTKYEKFLTNLATQYGLTKDELIQKFEEDQAEKAAQQAGIPIEHFKKMQELEQQVQELQNKYKMEAFNSEAERLVKKYNLTDNEAREVFQKIGGLGIDVLGNPKLLEIAYKALDYERAVEKGRQDQLNQSKKRRATSASPTLGTSGSNVDTTLADIDKEIDAFLKDRLK
jgi:hypothetical protein